MIRAESFIEQLCSAGFGLVSGVPCSYLTPLINTVIDSNKIDYLGAANEGEAVAIATGAQLGGLRAVAQRGQPPHIAERDLPNSRLVNHDLARPARRPGR